MTDYQTDERLRILERIIANWKITISDAEKLDQNLLVDADLIDIWKNKLYNAQQELIRCSNLPTIEEYKKHEKIGKIVYFTIIFFFVTPIFLAIFGPLMLEFILLFVK